MKNVVIAAAPTNRGSFKPIYASFPISDRTLLDCVGSQKATEEILNASLKFLGIPDSVPCVSGMYYKLPDRPSQTFEQFLFNLERRYRLARRGMAEQPVAQHHKTIFQFVEV